MSNDQAGYVESVVSPPAIDPNAITTQALGHSSTWVKGVESMPRLKPVGGQ
ncbi:hypothetical protein TorRG33x02_308460 [Trema orientale]|uniref:Uncharacterized protein n=1 Tax=Trema orientale TaxID=63057 RepID=A0A2P5BUD1_TREOI|nr:hypothetical protein TorRG33x02_308460 [Trema orientale]